MEATSAEQRFILPTPPPSALQRRRSGMDAGLCGRAVLADQIIAMLQHNIPI
jgi:hypothetical protein